MKRIIRLTARIFTLTAAAITAAASHAAITGQWKQHSTFDNSIVKIADTPGRTYFMGYAQNTRSGADFKAVPDCSLFYYDKEGDEIVAAVQRHDLAGVMVRTIDYNPEKGYLLITYSDQNIDLLFDDGSVRNIGALKNADIPGSKAINSICFDPANGLAWIATDFGYLAVDDEKFEVSESRNYGTPLQSVALLGQYVYLADGQVTRKALRRDPRMRLEDYETLAGYNGTEHFHMLGKDRVLISQYLGGEGDKTKLVVCNVKPTSIEAAKTHEMGRVCNILPTEQGCIVTSHGIMALVRKTDGNMQFVNRPADMVGTQIGSSWDFKHLYDAKGRKGLRELTRNSSDKFEVTRDYMLPDAPNAYLSRAMAVHPRHGLLVGSHGWDAVFNSNAINEPNLISALKDGFWTPMSFAYRNPQQANTGYNPLGLTIDPADDRYVWTGSNFSGITRINLDDPQDVIHYTHPADAGASLPGYVKMGDTRTWAKQFNMLAPQFDASNTLWSVFFANDLTNVIRFRYLTDADRRATTSAANAREWKTLDIPVNAINHGQARFLPLKSPVNKNLLVFMSYKALVVIDHNGTPDNPADDTVTIMEKLTDQDGNKIELASPTLIWEDPQSGVIWIAGLFGLTYATPRNLLQGQAVLNRVKVARNDGTSLADYLLNGVGINDITHDGEGRMWIATLGAGIVVTSADGRTIYQEITTQNSDLPSNMVYCLQYVPDTRSVMVSTSQGLSEFFIGGSAENNGHASDEVRAYPNPVAPDYHGWVTIDGLPDNSLVKVVDSRGSLVRELGRAEGGSVQWDATNHQYKRVQTGVYYILASPTSETGGDSRVGKILVMN